MIAEIYPLEKVIIDGITIYLKTERSEVEALIGKSQKIGKRYYYFNGEIAIDYNENKVEFIEFLGGVDGICQPIIYGTFAFGSLADKLIEILKKQAHEKCCEMENGHFYCFPNIGIGVYREAVPKEIEEMIAEAAVFGNPLSADEIEYEGKRANHFAAIGIGVNGYYDDQY